MQDLHCKEASKFHSKLLGARVAKLKEGTEVKTDMCKELNDFVVAATERAEARGIAEGESIGKKSMAMKLYADGTPIDYISRIANVPISKVEEWLNLQTV